MSLRRPHGEAWELPPKPGSLITEIKKFHRLRQYSRLFGCSCGKTFETANGVMRTAQTLLGIHHAAVKEVMEESRAGKSNYADE